MLRTIASHTSDRGGCGRRPRIEGLSLDRQEKCITFFPYPANQKYGFLAPHARINPIFQYQ
jgi:hypothetical protein